MRKILTFVFTISSLFILAQAPKEISYQGVARNISGTVLASQNIGIELKLHQGNASGTIVYGETHNKTTNSFGLFTLGIGSGSAFVGSFSTINWATGPFFLEVSIDPAGGTSYSSVGTQQFMSVPYALYAETSGNASSTPTIIINAPNTVTSSAGSYTINVPSAISYTAGTGISTTGNIISNTAPDQTVILNAAGATTITGTYPSFTINTPTTQAYTGGVGISTTGNTITNTAPDQTVTLNAAGATTVTGTYPSFTINTPTTQVYTAGAGIDITGGVITNTAVAVTPTITGTGVAVVTPTTGNTFNVDVPAPTFVTNGPTTISGTYPNYTVNSISSATTTLVQGNNISLNQSGNTYTVNAVTPSLDVIGGVLSGAYPTQTLTIPNTTLTTITQSTGIVVSGTAPNYTLSSPNQSLTINSNSLSITGGNTITLPVSTTYTNGAGISITSGSVITNAAPDQTVNISAGNAFITVGGSYPNYTLTPITPSLTGTGNANVIGSFPNQAINVPAASLTYTSATNELKLIDGGSVTTVTLNSTPSTTITAGNNITVSGSAPTYTVNAPSYSLTSNSNTLTLSNGTAITTATVPAVTLPLLSYTPSASSGILQSGPVTNTVSIPNYTLTNSTNTITLNNGASTSSVVVPVPVLSLSGSTLTSGPTTNSVNLSGLNGIYGGSGSIQTGSTTVTIATNTLTFLSGATTGKPIANFFGGGITGTHLAVGHINANPASIKLLGSVASTPVDYGYVSGSTNGIAISGGTSSNGLYATNNAEIGVGTFTTGIGKFVITHSATQSNPTMHLRETTGALSRIKFSNTGVLNRFFEVGASVNAADNFSAYSISFHDGTNYKSRFLIYGNGRTSINNLHTAESTFHVMDDNSTASGIASEGFGFEGQINLERNNPLGTSPTYTRGAVFGGQDIGKINFAAFDGGAFGVGAKIYARTTENATGSNKGTELIFAAVPTGTFTTKDAFKINGTGNLEVISGLQIPFNANAGKVLTSDAVGNASWQTITVPAAAWTSTLGNTTLVDINDRVGIGTTSPSSKLQVENILAGDRALYLYQAPSTTNEALFIDNRGSQQAAIIETNNASNTNVALLATSNGIGGAIRAQNTSSINTTDVLNVSQVGLGNAAYFSVNNSGNNAKAIDVYHNGNGVSIGAANSGTGRAGEFAIQNAANNSSALFVTTSGSGNAINATNSSTVNATVYAANGSAGDVFFSAGGTGRAYYGINNSTGLATMELASNGSGNVVYAYKNSGAPSGNVASFSNNSTSNASAAVLITDNGSGHAIHVGKPSGTGSGNVARFENLSAGTSADAVFASNSGAGATIHTANGSTSIGSNLGLLIEDGHIGSGSITNLTVASTNACGCLGSITLDGHSTDLAGTLRAVISASTGINIDFDVTFAKPYKKYPVIVVTPNSVPSPGSNYPRIIVTPNGAAGNYIGFKLTIVGGSINSGTPTPYLFNYMVIEGKN